MANPSFFRKQNSRHLDRAIPAKPPSDGAAESIRPKADPPEIHESTASPPENTAKSAIVLYEPGPPGVSLRARLLRTILPVVLAPLLIAGLVGYRIIQQRTTTRIQEQLKNQAMLTSEGTSAVLDELLLLPKTIAASPLVINEAIAGSEQSALKGLDQESTERLEKQFEETKLVRVHNRLNTYLKETSESTDISEILVTEANGFNVAYSQPTTDFVQSDEVWWQKGKENGQWISPPEFNFSAKGFTVELSQAIQDPQASNPSDSFVGVVRAVLPTRKFSLLAQYLQRTGISGSQRVQLIDGAELKVIDTFSPQGFRKSRDIIGGEPVEQLIQSFAKALSQSQVADNPFLNESTLLSELKSNRAIRKLSVVASEETTTVVSFVYRGRQYKIANIANTSWMAIASMERAEISAAARDSLLFLLVTTLLLSGLMAALILWLSKQLSHPISALAAQTESVAAGNFDRLVTPQGTTETRALTHSFNQLILRVKNLLRRQEVETEKVQLFAFITQQNAVVIADFKSILTHSLPEARRILETDHIFFYPTDSQFKDLATETAASNFPQLFNQPVATDMVPAMAFFAQPGDPAIAVEDNLIDDVDPAYQRTLKDLDIRASLSVPVFNNGRTIGFLITHRKQPYRWPSEDKIFLSHVAAQYEIVLDRITATQQVWASEQRMQASKEVARASQQIADTLAVEKQQDIAERDRQQKQLRAQVSKLITDIQGVSQGDLTVRIQTSEPELQTIAEVFNLTVSQLQQLVQQVKTSSQQVSHFLQQNDEAAMQLIQTTQSQKQEAARTMDRLQTMIESTEAIAQSAQQAALTAQTIATTIEAGEADMQATTQQIAQLNHICDDAIHKVKTFGRSAQHISQVTAIIRELVSEIVLISKQQATSSSNRSLEKDINKIQTLERSEKSAQQINHLANRTLTETELIDTFLQSLKQRSTQFIGAVEQINTQVAQSTEHIEQSQRNFLEVAVIAQQFNRMAQSVSTSTETQTQTSLSVSSLVQAVIELSGQTASFSQEIERALSETLTSAQELQESVSQFKVDP